MQIVCECMHRAGSLRMTMTPLTDRHNSISTTCHAACRAHHRPTLSHTQAADPRPQTPRSALARLRQSHVMSPIRRKSIRAAPVLSGGSPQSGGGSHQWIGRAEECGPLGTLRPGPERGNTASQQPLPPPPLSKRRRLAGALLSLRGASSFRPNPPALSDFRENGLAGESVPAMTRR
jgi:hypothetical protein